MNDLSLYKVTNPKSGHEDFLNCVGISSLLFSSISGIPNTNLLNLELVRVTNSINHLFVMILILMS